MVHTLLLLFRWAFMWMNQWKRGITIHFWTILDNYEDYLKPVHRVCEFPAQYIAALSANMLQVNQEGDTHRTLLYPQPYFHMQMHTQCVQILLLTDTRNNSYLIPANTDRSSNSPLPSEWTFQYICGTHFYEQEQGFLSNTQTTSLNILNPHGCGGLDD